MSHILIKICPVQFKNHCHNINYGKKINGVKIKINELYLKYCSVFKVV